MMISSPYIATKRTPSFYTSDFDAEGVRRALSEAKKDRTPVARHCQ